MSTAKGERRLALQHSRKVLCDLPCDKFFELPGRPNVVCLLRDYGILGPEEGAKRARYEMPFMFKAFEAGQIGPKRLAKMHGGTPRHATIHEYLDWTVTAQAAEEDDELDFGGFRVLQIMQRYRPKWPAPDQIQEAPKCHELLGAPKPPVPQLQANSKAISAATIRAGLGYVEVPFVATTEAKRGQGYGRCVLEAIEQVARACQISRILLCSTNEDHVKSTWVHLGFNFTTDADLAAWELEGTDLLHMENTVQMHRAVNPPRRWRPVLIRHEGLVQRIYAALDANPIPERSNAFYDTQTQDEEGENISNSLAPSRMGNGSQA